MFINFCCFYFISHLFKYGSCQSHAFIQVDNEVKYLVDGVSVPMSEVLNEQRRDGNTHSENVLSRNYIDFDPPFLDFNEHPAGIPHTRRVFVRNTSPDMNIHLHSLSGNTMHFHCTFFQDKVMTPGKNTSFDVVFLGREEGFIENTIYIHTSVGTYRYWVKAYGTPHPYRVRPLIGVRMPLNSSYTPSIKVHNPHDRDIQVEMVYSTGGDLHLELPGSSVNKIPEVHSDQWKIAPYRTKSIIKATFVARRENNHTAYIRVQLAPPITQDVVIPMEVEVSSEQGLFFPGDSLYFGFLTPSDPPVSLPLYLLNSAPKHIHIQNIISSTVNDAITIDFRPTKIPPGTVHPTQVATVTFDPSKASSGGKYSGKLLVKCKISSYKLSVPFSANLHEGSLHYNSSVTRFYSGSDYETESPTDLSGGSEGINSVDSVRDSMDTKNPPSISPGKPQDLIIKNTFKFAVVVYNVSLPYLTRRHFKMKWDGPVIIRRGAKSKVAELSLLSAGSNQRFVTELTVQSNVTAVQVPLVVFNGKLTKHFQHGWNEKLLDFGTLGLGEQQDSYFFLVNENPVEISLKSWGSSLKNSSVDLMGIHEGSFNKLKVTELNLTYTQGHYLLHPNHYAVFRIRVSTSHTEGIFLSEAHVRTMYELIVFKFRVRSAVGLLTIFPENVVLRDSFPGKISEQNLHILSTFSHSMTVDDIRPEFSDSRFSYVGPRPFSSHPVVVLPDQRSHIGKILFVPSRECGHDCYTGLSLHSKDGHQWISTFSLPSQTGDYDVAAFSERRNRFDSQSSRSTVSLLLDTSEVRSLKFKAAINYIWPKFTKIREIQFPLTHIHNVSHQEVIISNPSSSAVVGQILFLQNYPSVSTILPLLRELLKNENLTLKDHADSLSEVFHFDTKSTITSCDDPDDVLLVSSSSSSLYHSGRGASGKGNLSNKRSFENLFNTRVAKDSLPIYLLPNDEAKIRLSFTPLLEKKYSTVILLRNNLTIVEAILVSGEGGRGRVTFRQPLSKVSNSFHFNILEKHLRNCSASSLMESESVFSHRQTIIAQNDGKLPVQLLEFYIGNSRCQNYGFQVINCSPFTLQPNESRRIDVAFTPDFSLFHVEQKLVIKTSLVDLPESLLESDKKESVVSVDLDGNIMLHLFASIASSAVAKCSERFPRPSWEPLLYYSVITILIAMLVGTILRAFLEADHTLKSSFVPMTTVYPPENSFGAFDRNKIFNLANIGRNELNSAITASTANAACKTLANGIKNSPHSVNNNNNNKGIEVSVRKHSNLDSNISLSSHFSSSSSNINNSKMRVTRNLSLESSSLASSTNHTSSHSCSSKKSQGKEKKMHLGLTSFFSLPFSTSLQNEKKHNNNDNYNNTSVITNTSSSKQRGGSGGSCSNSSSLSKNKKNSSFKGVTSAAVLNNQIDNASLSSSSSDSSSNMNNNKSQNDEEISSTTTESSSVDDVFVFVKTSNNNNNNNLKKSERDKLQAKRKMTKINVGRISNKNSEDVPSKSTSSSISSTDTGFEITTKCKGIKRIKETVNEKNMSSSLELPYTIKPLKATVDNDQEKEKYASKPSRTKTSMMNKLSTFPSSQTKHRKEDYIVASEPPKSAPKAIIAPSTRSIPPNQPLAPRDPLYSSIVLGNTKQKDKITPVGKIIPEVKKIEKPLGAIGQKPPLSSSGGGLFQPSLLGPLTPPPAAQTPPSAAASSPFSQDALHNHLGLGQNPHSLYMGNVPGSSLGHFASVSSHSWDPKTFSSPTASSSTHSTAAMSEDDWLPFGRSGFNSVWGSDFSISSGGTTGAGGVNDSILKEKSSLISTPPPTVVTTNPAVSPGGAGSISPSGAAPPSLWESLTSFSIWSSPWSNEHSPLVNTGNANLWNPQPSSNSYHSNQLRGDNFPSCGGEFRPRSNDKNRNMRM